LGAAVEYVGGGDQCGSRDPGTALVTTTHVFHRSAQGWRLVVHHASPGTPQDARAPERAPQVLH